MTKGDKYYMTITGENVRGEKWERTSGPFVYEDAQYFLDGMQNAMRAYCSGVRVQYWREVYNEWEGPWKCVEFSFTV